jgi:hypothetical protein
MKDFIKSFLELAIGIIAGTLLVLILTSCEKEEQICDTSFRSHYLYSKDSLEFIRVVDINNEYVLYSDSNFYGQFKVIDDSYLNIMGKNTQTVINIQFKRINDSVHLNVYPICVYSDDCHVYSYYPSDTL